MSLDVMLTIDGEEVYSANITHNLSKMAMDCGIYEVCWRPEKIGITKAEEIIPILSVGIWFLETEPEYYKKWNAPNGWGTYDNFVPWLKKYLAACEKYPEAEVSVSR